MVPFVRERFGASPHRTRVRARTADAKARCVARARTGWGGTMVDTPDPRSQTPGMRTGALRVGPRGENVSARRRRMRNAPETCGSPIGWKSTIAARWSKPTLRRRRRQHAVSRTRQRSTNAV